MKATTRHNRRILRSLQRNVSQSSMQVTRSVGLVVSRATACRILRRLRARFIKKKSRPHWKPRHKLARDEFARVHQTWNREWKNVIFTDEKKFNLDGPDGFKCYWHVLGREYEYYSKRQGGGQSIMFWGAFAYGGTLPLKECRGRMNAPAYQELLRSVNLLDNGELIAGEHFVFQQDNAPCHSVLFSLFFMFFMRFVLGSIYIGMATQSKY